jgi:hypothetical protein
MHEENHEVAKMVACFSVTKTERKRKLLQSPDKTNIPPTPTPFESTGLVRRIAIGQWSW